MSSLAQKMGQAAIILALFAVIGSGLVALSLQITQERIALNERAALLRNLNALIPVEQYDNDLFNDIITLRNEALLGTEKPVTIYRARKQDQPVAAVLTPVAPNGYNGAIYLLVGINYQGVLAGVRVVAHRETPGLGDKIELRRSPWILNFKGHSLHNPQPEQWQVKRDGGLFDQFTGATITPRAVVKAVKNTLLFFQQYRDDIFMK